MYKTDDSIASISAYMQRKSRVLASVVPWGVYGFHFGMLCLVYLVFMVTGLIYDFPTNISLVQWDSFWYRSIMELGYVYKAESQCNLAFFPLFPLVWKALHVSAMTMSLINLALMLTGLTLVTRCVRIQPRTLLLVLSVPSLFFCYVPYSEAIFFFSGALLLYGLRWDKVCLSAVGIALACLTRPAASLLIPVVLVSLVLNYRRDTFARDLKRALVLLLAAFTATGSVILLQYRQTGQWLKFFEAQKYWGRVLNVPTLFFTTNGDWHWVWMDGMAFFAGMVCLAAIIYMTVRKWEKPRKTISPVFIFSIGYMMMAALVAVFFGEQADWIKPYGTSVYSVNRFITATPFFAVFLSSFFRYIRFEFKTIYTYLILANVVGFMFAAFTGVSQMIYWAIIVLYGSLYLVQGRSRWDREIWMALYLLNIIFQVWMFNSFLHGGGIL